jgi:uncharacterized protein (DUF433 family)
MAQSSVRIATDLHAEPHIEGRRVTVRRIQGLVEEAGRPVEEVAEQLDLDVADVYGALQYYHSHPDEVREAERERAEREQQARDDGAKTLAEIKRERT